MAYSVEGTLKEFTRKRNPYAPKPAESPFGDFPTDWHRPGPKGSRKLGGSGRTLSPGGTVTSPTPAATTSSAVDPLPAIQRNSGFGGATSSLLRTRRLGTTDQAGKARTTGGDGSFAESGGPPKAGAFRPRPIGPTKFRMFYERGDLPISIAHRPNGNKLDWRGPLPPEALDYHHYLPIFFDGLREIEEPYRFLAVQGCYDLLAVGGAKIPPTIPQLITPIKTALHTRVPEVIITVLKVLQRLVLSSEDVGVQLVPYHRQLLPILGMFKGRTRNTGDMIDYAQRKRGDLGELIEETLQLLELRGGPDALINIKYMIPTYESCQVAFQG